MVLVGLLVVLWIVGGLDIRAGVAGTAVGTGPVDNVLKEWRIAVGVGVLTGPRDSVGDGDCKRKLVGVEGVEIGSSGDSPSTSRSGAIRIFKEGPFRRSRDSPEAILPRRGLNSNLR